MYPVINSEGNINSMNAPPLLYLPLSTGFEVSLDPGSPGGNSHQSMRLVPDWPGQVTGKHPEGKGVKSNRLFKFDFFFSFPLSENGIFTGNEHQYEKLSPDVSLCLGWAWWHFVCWILHQVGEPKCPSHSIWEAWQFLVIWEYELYYTRGDFLFWKI